MSGNPCCVGKELLPCKKCCAIAGILSFKQQISHYSVQAQAFTDSNIADVSSYEELKAAVAERKWARGAWAGQTPAIWPHTITFAPIKLHLL